MAICPFATYKPVVNHGGLMTGHLGLVLHVQEGDNSLYGYFNNPASQVSAHFWCGKDGTLEQYVDTNLTAWAEVAGNADYLSVETEGFDTEPLTAAQVSKVAQLLAWSAGLYGFPITGPVAHGQPGFTPHSNPDGTPDPAWGDHPCPGLTRLGQMPAIVQAAQPGPAPTPTPPPGGTMPVSQAVSFKTGQTDVFQVSGGTLWHKWITASGPANEPVAGPNGGKANVTVTLASAVPMVAVNGGQCQVTVEDTSGRVWYFAQSSNSSTWGVLELP